MEINRMATRPVSILDLVILREYAPLDTLLRLLPKKAQRALSLSQSAIDVEWTCVDATSEFIVLGSNISIVYLFDRQEQQLGKLKCEDKSSSVTCVKLLTCLDHQLAVGTSNGHVEIFLLPSKSHGNAVQAKKFVLEHLHQTLPVTCVEWSSNGMKLFSGDTHGKVVQTDIDFYENRCQATCVVTEEEPISQLSYAHKKLIVSTLSRTIVCAPDDGKKITQVGQQPRKSKIWDILPKDKTFMISRGNYGAHFVPGLCKSRDATMYVARPGWRLWLANTEGTVLETIKFKDLIAQEHPNFKLHPDTPPEVMPPPSDLQLGLLLPFSNGLLVSWSMSSVVVLQPHGPEGALVVASNFGELGCVVSLAVTRHEIFVLRKGCERCLVRIATAPEMQIGREPAKSERDFGRIQTTKLTLSEDSSQMILAPSVSISADRMTSTKIRNKFISVRGFLSKAADELSDKAVETKNKMERNLERSLKLNLPIPERRSSDSISVSSDRSSNAGDDQTSTEPGTPEAALSERLMVNVINASSMKETSPTHGRTSPSPSAAFRSPSNSLSGNREGNNPVVNGADASPVKNRPGDEMDGDQGRMKELAQAVTEAFEKELDHADQPVELPNSAVEVTPLKTKHSSDRVSIVITEDPKEDQAAHVISNLSKRISYHSKISQDTLENISTDFSDSIVFQKKKTTKKKKKTVKGNKNGPTIVEIGQQSSTPFSSLDSENDHLGPSHKPKPSLSSIQEGEALEERSDVLPSEQTSAQEISSADHVLMSERLTTSPASSAHHPSTGMSTFGLGSIQEEISETNSKEEVSETNSKEEIRPPDLSELSLPRSLKSTPEEIMRSKKRTPFNAEVTLSRGPPSAEHAKFLNVDSGKDLSISLPRSLHSNDLPHCDDGDLSPVVSPRSPRAPQLLEDGGGRQVRRLGMIMENFDLDSVPEDTKLPSSFPSPVPEEAKQDPIQPMPILPPRKKHTRLEALQAMSPGSRPMSEFEDIYSKYRRTVMMIKESVYDDSPSAGVHLDSDGAKDPLQSDNSETESHDSDEGEEVESTLPDSIQQKLAGSWMQCSTPNYIYHLVASERHIWYVDSRYKAHHSLSSDITCKWSKLKDAPSHRIAISPSGSIVWRIHPKTAQAMSSAAITQRSPVGYRWINTSKDVMHVCLDENMAWIIKQNGQLCAHKGISREQPFSKEFLIESNAHVVQIAANNNVVWARTAADRVVYRAGVSARKPQGTRWMELPDDENLRMVCIALDSKNTGWAIDGDGMVWFRTGVTKEKPMGDDQKWWQVCMSEYLMEDPNVLRMMVNMAGTATKVDRVVNWLKKQCYKATSIAANSTGVWVCSSYHYKTTLHVSRGNLLGSRWEVSNPVGLAAKASWKSVCASPSYGPSGMIWALQTSGEIFCFSPETRKPHMVQSPDTVLFDYISATTNAMWALSTRNEIYVRLEITDRCPGGTKWKKLDLIQFGTRHIVHYTLGNDVVWAVDSLGGIHFRLGVTLPKHDALPLAWVPVDGKPVGYGVYFTHVFCSPANDVVWAIDNKKTVYARQGVSQNMPVGLGWEPVEGTQANQLCMSADSVWALCPNGELACRFGISTDNAAGDYWKKISGNFRYLTVSQNDELWTIGADGRLFHRLTKMFIRSATTKAAAMEAPEGEDGWELL